MKKETMDSERRKQARLEKLGTNTPSCGTCGLNDWSRIEQHHVAGQKHDNVMALLCANCHLIVTDDQKDHPAFDADADPLLSSIGHFLLGLADMLRIAVEKLVEFGHQLIELARSKPSLGGQP